MLPVSSKNPIGVVRVGNFLIITFLGFRFLCTDFTCFCLMFNEYYFVKNTNFFILNLLIVKQILPEPKQALSTQTQIHSNPPNKLTLSMTN